MDISEKMDDLKTKLKEMVVHDLKLSELKPADIDDDAPLFEEGLGLDSLDAVELVVLIQKHFNVQIKDMEEGKKAFASINALAQYISDQLRSSGHELT
ncbi:MAG: phosphopantetheine-binding protein [Thermodesulfobacteriota bacterium]|nr:phosphopantetheine-binding protein [Thermodesulfobacteriota bacterium]